MRSLAVAAVLVASTVAYSDPKVSTIAYVQAAHVKRVVDPNSTVDATAVETAIDHKAIDRCPHAIGTLVAWIAFERGKATVVDVAGTKDVTAATCIGNVLRKATLAAATSRVVAIVDIEFIETKLGKLSKTMDAKLGSLDGTGMGKGTGTGRGAPRPGPGGGGGTADGDFV
jgi:hypothetical protein